MLTDAPYSPHLAPYDFFLLPRIKKYMKEHHFDNKEEVKNKTRMELANTQTDEFEKCFQRWLHRFFKYSILIYMKNMLRVLRLFCKIN